jgi:hypothetical protein
LPPDTTSPASANTSGLSETPFASVSSVVAAWRRTSRQAPITCGWQRQAVRVLDAIVVQAVRRADGAAVEERAQGSRRLDLPAVPA